MSTSPPALALSRRSLLRGAASVGALLAVGPVACSGTAAEPDAGTGATTPSPGDDGSTALLRWSHRVADDATIAALPAPAGLGALTTDAAVVQAVADRHDQVAADLQAGRTVLADGWLLPTTEASVLVAYAHGCALPSC